MAAPAKHSTPADPVQPPVADVAPAPAARVAEHVARRTAASMEVQMALAATSLNPSTNAVAGRDVDRATLSARAPSPKSAVRSKDATLGSKANRPAFSAGASLPKRDGSSKNGPVPGAALGKAAGSAVPAVVLTIPSEASTGSSSQAIAAAGYQDPPEAGPLPVSVAFEATDVAVQLAEGSDAEASFEVLSARKNVSPGAVSNPALQPGESPYRLGASNLEFAMLEGDLDRLVSALEAIGPTKLLGSRRVMVADRTTTELPIDSGRLTATPPGASADSSQPSRRLFLRPMVRYDGVIYLEMGSVTATAGPLATATVMLLDGSTAVVGGLISRHVDAETGHSPAPRYAIFTLLTPHLVRQ
jgi:hypothetical protein